LDVDDDNDDDGSLVAEAEAGIEAVPRCLDNRWSFINCIIFVIFVIVEKRQCVHHQLSGYGQHGFCHRQSLSLK
jgi:hypothetical protein